MLPHMLYIKDVILKNINILVICSEVNISYFHKSSASKLIFIKDNVYLISN